VSGRKGKLSKAAQCDVGVMVLTARENGVPWKELMATLDTSRKQLWRYAASVSREKLRQKNRKLRHREA